MEVQVHRAKARRRARAPVECYRPPDRRPRSPPAGAWGTGGRALGVRSDARSPGIVANLVPIENIHVVRPNLGCSRLFMVERSVVFAHEFQLRDGSCMCAGLIAHIKHSLSRNSVFWSNFGVELFGGASFPPDMSIGGLH